MKVVPIYTSPQVSAHFYVSYTCLHLVCVCKMVNKGLYSEQSHSCVWLPAAGSSQAANSHPLYQHRLSALQVLTSVILTDNHAVMDGWRQLG